MIWYGRDNRMSDNELLLDFQKCSTLLGKNETRFSRAMKFATMSRDSITRESGCMEVFVTANINCMFMAVLIPDEA